MFRFSASYFLFAALLFLVEAAIALYAHDEFIRPFFGDFLVVMLVYCAVKSIVDTPVLATCAGVLAFAFAIEGLQAVHFLRWAGWEQITLLRIVLGNYFQVLDLVSYTAGIAVVYGVERWRMRSRG